MKLHTFLARSALGSTSGGAGSPNGLTEGVSFVEWYNVGCCTIHPGAIEKPGLRADSIRPYNPCDKPVQFIQPLCPGTGWVDYWSTPTGRMERRGYYFTFRFPNTIHPIIARKAAATSIHTVSIPVPLG